MFQKCLVKTHKEIGEDLTWALGKPIESDYDSDWGWQFASKGCLLAGEENKIIEELKDFYSQYGDIDRVVPSYHVVVIVFKEEI